jgi:SAM-dependent methyltransferase
VLRAVRQGGLLRLGGLVDDVRLRVSVMTRAGAPTNTDETEALRTEIQRRYAAAAVAAGSAESTGCCGPTTGSCGPTTGCCGDEPGCGCGCDTTFGSGLYSDTEAGQLPSAALAASLGCGNPTAVADLQAGQTVLDLGSGGGIDVILSARRVGPTGFAFGLDMTDEMLALARRNAADAGITNVEFLRGNIEQVPLPDGSVDVIISNCVINLSVDKPAVFAEMFRVLRRGGRVGVSDVVAEDRLSATDRASRGDFVGCIAGALSQGEYAEQLRAAGFADVEITFTHSVADGMHGAIIRATKQT